MAICIHNDKCGGCIYQEIPYNEQLILKGKEVLRLFDEKDIKFEKNLGIEGSPNQMGYRNKMEYTFGDEVKDGPMTLGMHQKGRFMSIVTVDECQLVDMDFNIILRETLNFCNEKCYRPYHKKTHKGMLRNLIVRKGEHTNEILVNIVTSSQKVVREGNPQVLEDFDEEAFVEMLSKLQLKNTLVGVLHTLNDNMADFVHCESLKVVWGRDYYQERIMGLNFKVSAFSFFQTNILAIEKLYTEAMSFLMDPEGKIVYDLYCGTGTITQALALRAKNAIGIEIVEEAVDTAKENAALNNLENCHFIAGDVLEKLDEVIEKPDVIVLDPPRMGVHPKALEKILRYGVEEILYISCNPKSLADNLSTMQLSGYEVKKFKAFDNFPFTKHIETICLLQKKNNSNLSKGSTLL